MIDFGIKVTDFKLWFTNSKLEATIFKFQVTNSKL